MPRNPRKQIVGKRRENKTIWESAKLLADLQAELRTDWKAGSAAHSLANSDADSKRPA